MVIITNVGNFVEINLSALIPLGKTRYHTMRLMKDKVITVKLDAQLRWVEVETVNTVYQLDQNQLFGAKVTSIDAKPITTNTHLALELSLLKNI
jgi:hypothetical protein